VCLETHHKPEKATNVDIDGNLPPCFTGTSQNYDWVKRDQCCELTRSSKKTAEEHVAACLTPSRTCCDKRVLYLLGDSHASTYIATVIAAFQGNVEVVWATVGLYCGFNSAEFTTKTIACKTINNDQFEHLYRRCKKVIDTI